MKTMQSPYAVRTSFISFAALIAALGAPVLGQESSNEDQVITNEESEGPGAPLYIGPSDMRRVQQQLNQEGYDSGNVDGTWGNQTVSALCSFQEAEGIEPTGRITPETLSALDLDDVFTSGSEEGEGGEEGDDDQVITQETSDGEGVPLYLSTSTVRQIQQNLNQDGYDAGNVDGEAGEEFSVALTDYQQAEGLEPTGTITIETLEALDVSFDRAEDEGDDQVITQETSDTGDCGGEAGTSADSSASGGSEGNSTGGTSSANAGDSGGTAVYLSTADIREIKQTLNQAGYDAGDVDGEADDQLASALESYQEAEGLEPTGTLTTRTVASLDVTDISFLASGSSGSNNSDRNSSGGNNSGNDDSEGSGNDNSDGGNSNGNSDSGNSNENGNSDGGEQGASDNSN